jgi:hypothetical protein
MSNALTEHGKLLEAFKKTDGVTVSQMFGKPCLKINGKAFLAQHFEVVVFKLSGTEHARALGLSGAALWDPSGKGRTMKEWVALPANLSEHFAVFANAALEYAIQG